MSGPPLIEAIGLGREFEARAGRWRARAPKTVRAVGSVDLSVMAGESVGLVGESGCGKTTLSRLLLGLDTPTRGRVRFRGRDLAALTAEEYAAYRRAIQPVFQDPYAALDPRMRVDRIIAEPLRAGPSLTRRELSSRVARALERVGLEHSDGSRLPHEFSGGQRQRIAIARALAVEPSLIVLDEAVSSQDVSIRAQLLHLLRDIRDASGVGYLFISHDLSNVRFLATRLCVMYLGDIVEQSDTETLFTSPQHPYTRALLSAWLPPDPAAPRLPFGIIGELPSAMDPPAGCSFHTRCPEVMPDCRTLRPPLRRTATGAEAACHLYSLGTPDSLVK